MALIRSTMLATISGSLAGATFARNRGGAYVRNRTVPVNPNSDMQVLARGAMTNSAQYWRTLADAVQESWKQYADNTPTTNRLGETMHISGFSQFVKLNGFLQFLGFSIHPNAPTAYGTAAAITGITATIDSAADTLDITGITGGSTNAGANYGIWISNPLSPGITFYKGPWHYVDTTTGASMATFSGTIPFNVGLGQSFRLRLRYHDENWRMGNEWISPIVGPAA